MSRAPGRSRLSCVLRRRVRLLSQPCHFATLVPLAPLAACSLLVLGACDSPVQPKLSIFEKAPPVALGIWISKAELDSLPMSGANWSGIGELKHTADAEWTVQAVEWLSPHVYNVQAMAGALVFARLHPDASAEQYRTKVVDAIERVIALPDMPDSTVTGANRFLGTWAITADLINLPEYDVELDARFRRWLKRKLDTRYERTKTVRLQVANSNNQGSWATFSTAAASSYLEDRRTLDQIATRMRRWLGNTSVRYELNWTDDQSWQVNPSDTASWVGINPKGAMRDGFRFDGIQPSDQNRGTPTTFDPLNFPNDFSDVRYNETSLHGVLGALLILHRNGYTDLIDASDQAVLRAVQWVKYAADTYPEKGYRYFTGPHIPVRPLINYLYPSANLPGTNGPPQPTERAYGYAWTEWTHAGRRVR